MNRYEKGQIYKIVSPDFSKCYIGSTCETLSRRMERHRCKYKQYLQGKEHKRPRSFDLFDEFGETNCKIVWVEDCPCSSRKELEAREGHYIQTTDCVNKLVVGRSEEEIRRLKKYYQEQWKERNQEYIKETSKKYREEHKDKNREYQKAYYQNNLEISREKRKEYRKTNSEQIKRQKQQLITCPCGSFYQRCSYSRHQKSVKHQNWLKKQEQPEEEQEPLQQLD